MFPCARQLEVQIHPVDMLATPGAAGDTGHPESGPIIPFGVFSSQTRDESVPNLTETKLTFLSNSPFEQHLISNLAVGSQTTDKNPTEAESNNHFHSKFVSYFWCIPFSAPICANNVAPETRSEETDEPHFESNHDTYISSYMSALLIFSHASGYHCDRRAATVLWTSVLPFRKRPPSRREAIFLPPALNGEELQLC